MLQNRGNGHSKKHDVCGRRISIEINCKGNRKRHAMERNTGFVDKYDRLRDELHEENFMEAGIEGVRFNEDKTCSTTFYAQELLS